MPNLYVPVNRFKSDLDINGSSDDGEIARVTESVSRDFDEICHAPFFNQTATRYLDSHGGADLALSPRDSLVSVTTLKVDSDRATPQTFDETLTEGTHFWLYPYNETLKWLLRLIPGNSTRTRWPNGQHLVELVAVFGRTNLSEETGDTVQDDPQVAAGATALTVTAGTNFSVGDTLIIESEEVYVSGISEATLTVARAQNGTTAAVHLKDVAITRRRYLPAIEEAVKMQVSRFLTGAETGFQDAGGEGVRTPFTMLYRPIQDLLQPHIIRVVV